MNKLIVANWKMNPESYEAAEKLADAVEAMDRTGADVVLCPPFIWLLELVQKEKDITWGAQDVFYEEKGAYTGEVSPAMLVNSGVKYVIIGHSERRIWQGETDSQVNHKIQAAEAAGLEVILCVGEGREVREKGIDAAKEFVAKELEEDLRGVTKPLFIAYEPIWAISTAASEIGRDNSDNPESAAEMVRFVKEKCGELGVPCLGVLYGGSVNKGNAKAFLSHPELDGALVGGASLKADEFEEIINQSR